MEDIQALEQKDKVKSSLLRYIMFKKRTEMEIRRKFSNIDENLLEELIQELKENGYIDDERYLEKVMKDYIMLNKLSIVQLKYKIFEKGIKMDKIEEYIDSHKNSLQEYEIKSAQSIYEKRKEKYSEEDIKKFLKTKGYRTETLEEIFSH